MEVEKLNTEKFIDIVYPECLFALSITGVALFGALCYGVIFGLQTIFCWFFIPMFIGLLLPYVFIYLLVSEHFLWNFNVDGKRRWGHIALWGFTWWNCLKLGPVLVGALLYLPNLERAAANIRPDSVGNIHLSRYHLTSNRRIRFLLANNIGTPKDTLEELAHDKLFAPFVAANAAASTETLNDLAKAPSPVIRKAVAINPATSCAILKFLAKDADMAVRNIALSVYHARLVSNNMIGDIRLVPGTELKQSTERCD